MAGSKGGRSSGSVSRSSNRNRNGAGSRSRSKSPNPSHNNTNSTKSSPGHSNEAYKSTGSGPDPGLNVNSALLGLAAGYLFFGRRKEEVHHHHYNSQQENNNKVNNNETNETNETLQDTKEQSENIFNLVVQKYNSCIGRDDADVDNCRNVFLDDMKLKYQECLEFNTEGYCRGQFDALSKE